MTRSLAASAIALGLLLCPCAARADWFVVPFSGLHFGGDTRTHRLTFGASGLFLPHGVIGGEADFSYAPDFFQPSGSSAALVASSHLTTLMATVVVTPPICAATRRVAIRPYALAGLALISARINGIGGLVDVHSDDAGIVVGGGAMGFLNTRVGWRGDVRYVRDLRDSGGSLQLGDGKFDFWRVSAGVVVMLESEKATGRGLQ